MPKIKSKYVTKQIYNEIKSGTFGNSGEKFLSVRELAEKYSVSLVTAQNIVKSLNESGVIKRFGKSYFLTTGKISPNSLLQTHIKNRTNNCEKQIGIHIPKFDNPFFAALLNEIIKFVYKNGFSPLVMCSNQNIELEKQILENFIKIGVCGVISCPNNTDALECIYENYPFPLVFLAEHTKSKHSDFAGVDNSACARHVAHHLLEMEYKNFLYIGAETDSTTDKRCAAFIETLKENGYDIPKKNIITLTDNENFTIPYSVAQHIKSQEKPLGIFCFHDIIAVGVIMLCEKLGLKIPQDIGVVGFDNLAIAKQCRPTLSSIAYRFDKMAEVAVNLLLKKINCESNSKIKPNDFVNHSLKIRDSSRRKPL